MKSAMTIRKKGMPRPRAFVRVRLLLLLLLAVVVWGVVEGVGGGLGVGDDGDDSDDDGSVVVVDEVVGLIEDERKVLRGVGGSSSVKDLGLVFEKVVRELKEPDVAATNNVVGGTVMIGVSMLEERGPADEVVGCGSARETGVVYDVTLLFGVETDEGTSEE